ncbi:hypothetical protein MKW92_016952 [Papaver armeniacum]|nr:hypothetical protein MKW92_016952 [Papaver armeniacum]
MVCKKKTGYLWLQCTVIHFLMLLSISGEDLDLTKMKGILLKPVSGNFVVVDHGNVVNYLKGTSGTSLNLRLHERRMYKLCFHNPYSTPGPYLSTSMLVISPMSMTLQKMVKHLDPINVKIAELREASESVIAERSTQKRVSTRKRVVFYTILEYYKPCLVTCTWSFLVVIFFLLILVTYTCLRHRWL